ncbi:MAG TPA: biotin/lipoyl-containing protein [Thermoanaerobaculia bacterium]|nr:biotin/lipoyl-containing protein [Thermoanaerobaculia bacterium]
MSDRVEVLAFRDREAEIRVDGKVVIVPFVNDGKSVHFAYDGDIWSIDVGEKGGRAKARHRDHSMEAPMPGLVLKILVKAGDVVSRGMPLLVLEAMKMEHQITAPRDGTVEAVNCREGELVQPGVDLIVLTEPSAL